ncbi:hypothetical protein GCM10011374_32300 [Kocuria dechangensis]|uniref:SnoaL-like domain-containing protein n=1 Tax=Kocuria dechangensis TaxID=1176249 RepID=A0A917H301_9MICC|nr:nuclear transport factor 2 family protein [Kocuria dechangensis]GGG65887.1 hypothetical protein GCM10011374_32300 [Kocuria dechangensis]
MGASARHDHREAITQWMAAFNAHDAVGVGARYAQDAVVDDPAYQQPQRGRKPVQDHAQAYITAMPDVAGELTRVITDEDNAAVEMTISGVYAGPLVLPTGTLPPTGHRLRFAVAFFCRFGPEGTVVEEHRYYDAVGILHQLKEAHPQRG